MRRHRRMRRRADMSNGQTSVVGTVVLTVIVTCGVLVGGWFAYPRFFKPAEPTAAAAANPVDVPAPRRKKAPRGKTVAPEPSKPKVAEANAAVQPPPSAVDAESLGDRDPAANAPPGGPVAV